LNDIKIYYVQLVTMFNNGQMLISMTETCFCLVFLLYIYIYVLKSIFIIKSVAYNLGICVA